MAEKNPKDVISSWLSQRAGFSKQSASEISDAVIAEITANPREGIKKLLGREPKAYRIAELERLLRGVVSTQEAAVASMSHDAPAQHTTEGIEEPCMRMQRAVDEAVALGIVREEFLPAKTPTSQTAYLLASSHYNPDVSDPNSVDPLVKMSQVELFQLAVLMQRTQVTGRILVEGVRHTGGSFPRGKFLLPDGAGGSAPLQSPALQEHFFNHPTELVQIIDELLRAGKGSIPLFYRLSSMPFDGAERPETQQRTDALVQRLSRSFEFHKILENIKRAAAPTAQSGGFQIQTLHRNGEWHLIFGGRYVVPAMPLKREAEAHLATMEEWKKVDEQREKDTQQYLKNSSADTVPIAWMGLAHAPVVAEELQKTMNVHIIVPRSSAHVDGRKLNEDQTQHREIDFTKTLLHAANQALAQRPPNS